MKELLTSLIQKVKEIAYKQGLIADYIIERGTYGIWEYEKCNSGILKCYGKEEKTLTSASSAWRGGYSCGTQIVDVPFMLSGIYGNATAQHSNVAYMSNVVTTGSKLYYLPLFDNPNLTRNVTIQYYVVGKWKSGGVLTNLVNLVRRCNLCSTF